MAVRDVSPDGPMRGAYGLRIEGLAPVERLLVRADSSWPRLQLIAQQGSIEGFDEQVDVNRATFVLLGAVAVVERSPGRAVFIFEDEPNLEALVHPYLAPIAGLFAHWHGRESLHAGAFVAGGGAWGVLAGRSGGKSSTLARLALDGVPIVTDDVLVVENETAFAGPRAIDLREEPAGALGVGEPLGVVGARERWRLRLEDVGGAFELKGWVFLEWGDELAVTRVSAGSRLQRLASQRTIHLMAPDPTALLRLSALPAFELRRPRDWSSLEEATTLLLESLP